MSKDQDKALSLAAKQLYDRQLRARIPNSEKLFREKLERWRSNPNSSTEYRWRVASLIHGAMLIGQGDYLRAITAYSNYPNSIEPATAPQPSPDCTKLSAMMWIGEAFARTEYGLEEAAYAAEMAITHLAQHPEPRYDRWRAVADTILDEFRHASGEPIASGAGWAAIIDRQQQPELYARAMFLHGQGDGKIRHLLIRRTATLQPSECLYFLKE